jgi:hypothetical protein
MLPDDYADADPILRAVCSHWVAKIEKAKKHKDEVFQRDADVAMSFYDGPKDWAELMGDACGIAQEIMPETIFQMSVNKAFELVTIYGPALYYQVPVRTVEPRQPVAIPADFLGDPLTVQAFATQENLRLAMDQTRADLMESYLNWTPRENHLDAESRSAIEEALIKGRGCLWTELRQPPGSSIRIAASLFDSVDNLMVDPDAPSLEKATWIARKCVHPVWQVERDYGLPPGTLKGNMESQAIQAEISLSEDAQYDRKRGLTNDLLVYWKIYSKMGIGGRLSGINREFRGPLELFGDFVFLAVAKGVPFPLNLPPSLQQQAGTGNAPPQEVFDAVAWPTPFWADGGWPVTVLDFHKRPNCPWPMSHLKAGLGELKFLNWMTSFIAGKIRNTCRDFLAVRKDIGEEIKTNLLEGRDLTLLEIEADHGTVSEVIQFLQHPQMNGDIWKVIAAIEANFDKRVGLTDLMYGEGGATQIRSAQEASVRNQNANIRPEDMAKQVEAWMSAVAAKEAILARYHLASDDVAGVLGPVAGLAWDRFVRTADLDTATRQLEYAVEAGSTRRPNKETQIQRSNEGVQTLLPVLQGYAQTTGDVAPLNNLLADWAKARDLPAERYQLRAMPPPPPAAPAEPPPA